MKEYRCDMCGKHFKNNQGGIQLNILPLNSFEVEDEIHFCIDCKNKIAQFIKSNKQTLQS